MTRKQLFVNLGHPVAAEPDGGTPRPARMRVRPILGAPELLDDAAASPVGAIGQALGEVAERARHAADMERRLAEGQTIVDLDANLVDPSFVKDRMATDPEASASLVESIRLNGQQVPILVRPHPKTPGRYQVAYGHRRLEAAKELGRFVRTVVRNLSDEDVAIAQGQENNERRDLSYIEKARFAAKLEQRFGRSTAMTAMGLYKSDLSNMLSVVIKIPPVIVNAIGPAPSTGRRGWIELADAISSSTAAVVAARAAVDDLYLPALNSDERFKRVLDAAKLKTEITKPEPTRIEANGREVAVVVTSSRKVSCTIDRRKEPEFARFFLERLQALRKEFEAGDKGRP